jgi:signal recognition particle receptor subunit beta
MDYGRVEIDGRVLHLSGTPGQTRFSFMWDILAKEMQAFIVLVDSMDRLSFPDAADLIALFSSFHAVPYLVAANKNDLNGAASLDEVRRGTQAAQSVIVTPCVATQKASVQQVLRQVITLIEHAQ